MIKFKTIAESIILKENMHLDMLMTNLHFAETDQEISKAREAIKKNSGWDDDDLDYSFKRFRKEIGFPNNLSKASEFDEKRELRYSEYSKWLAKVRPQSKVKPKSLWDKNKYQKWIKSMEPNVAEFGEDGVPEDYSRDMAYNAKFEPGLIDYVRNVIKRNEGDESPSERIEWDMENSWNY